MPWGGPAALIAPARNAPIKSRGSRIVRYVAGTIAMTSAEGPTLSVVVRSIGRDTLDRALNSIAAQGAPAAEIVIVAASGRDHAPIPERFGPCPVVAVRPDIRLQRAAAADAGLRAARGEWITFLDDDDELLPGHLHGLISSAARLPACAR